MRIKVKLYFTEMIWQIVDWIPLPQDRVMWQAVVEKVKTKW